MVQSKLLKRITLAKRNLVVGESMRVDVESTVPTV